MYCPSVFCNGVGFAPGARGCCPRCIMNSPYQDNQGNYIAIPPWAICVETGDFWDYYEQHCRCPGLSPCKRPPNSGIDVRVQKWRKNFCCR
ncbi:MAG: hypothetical protein LBR73_08670 [Oscillospiraceae bacterium]|jgi:hypothetical protein|nr:hypothetical protein [Oscillospiraceae bacterium]